MPTLVPFAFDPFCEHFVGVLFFTPPSISVSNSEHTKKKGFQIWQRRSCDDFTFYFLPLLEGVRVPSRVACFSLQFSLWKVESFFERGGLVTISPGRIETQKCGWRETDKEDETKRVRVSRKETVSSKKIRQRKREKRETDGNQGECRRVFG